MQCALQPVNELRRSLACSPSYGTFSIHTSKCVALALTRSPGHSTICPLSDAVCIRAFVWTIDSVAWDETSPVGIPVNLCGLSIDLLALGDCIVAQA